MWKHRLVKLVHKLSTIVNATRFAKLRSLARLERKCKRLMWRCITFGRPFLIQVHGQKMFINPRQNFIERYAIQSYEPYTTELFKGTLKPGDTVLDIGAHFGYFSLIAAKSVGQEGKVYAFEPGPENFELLVRNVRLNGYGHIHPANKAVGSRCGPATFLLAESSDGHSFFPHPLSPTKARISVECTTIDEFLRGESVNVAKIDIEGGELSALDGMKETVAKNRELVLFIELMPTCLRNAGCSPNDLLSRLEEMGYEVQVIDEASRSLKPVVEDALLVKEESPAYHANLYCRRR